MNIPVHIVNLITRNDRRESILNEFRTKTIFSPTIHEPISHPIGSYSLWKTFRHIVSMCKDAQVPYFIFCEDDHVFTKHFSEEKLIANIRMAQNYHADILLGGVSWFDLPIQCEHNLFYVDQFNGMQFSLIFQSFYDTILAYEDSEETVTDICLSNLSANIFVMWPFLSIQKEFGYSDVTSFNNTPNYVNGLFQKTSKELFILDKVKKYYDHEE